MSEIKEINRMAQTELLEKTEKELEAWDPFRDLGFGLPFGGLFEDFLAPMRMTFPALPAMPKVWMPRVDIQETDKEYTLTASLPGVRKEDVKIEVKDDCLTLSGERKMEKEEKGKTWLRKESSYGSFHRCLRLPEGVHPEDVHAAQKDGLLTVTVKKPVQAKKRGISIRVD